MQQELRLLRKYGMLGIGGIESENDGSIHKRKTIVLTNQISVLILLICSAFILFDFLNGIYTTQVFYLPLALVSIVAYFLNRKKYHALAKHLIIITSIISTFYFLLRTGQETFVAVMFFPIVIGAFALFDYKHLYIGFIYFLVCLALFLVDTYVVIEGVIVPPVSMEMVKNIRTINYLIISLTLVFLILFILSINFQTEKKIREQNEELVKTNNELDKFVYSTSHDLRAPLMSILGLVNIAEHEQNKTKMDECLKLITDRVHTLDNFITEIIDISRNKKSAVQLSSFNLRKTVNRILDDFRYMEEFEKIGFDIEIEKDLEIRSDETRFTLIMRNLISNAIKYHNFMKDDPRIRISCIPEEFTMKVKVADNGFGIPEKHQSQLFDMFFRGTQNGKGTGLGLYIVKETALKLEGKISLESTVGNGSTFELEIPRVHENGST